MLIAISFASGCSQVEIKDMEVCADAAEDGAYCAHTQKQEERDVPKGQWDLERKGQLCLSQQAYGENKAAVEKLCSKPGACTYEFKKKFNQATQNIDKIIKKANDGGPSNEMGEK